MRALRANWAALSAIVAALSLAAALYFNGTQIRDSARAQEQAKIATELGLLTQLQNVMSESVYERVQFERQFRQLRAGRRAKLTRAAYRATAEEAANMDYLAWLFNHGHLTTEGAELLWGPQMVCEYKQAFAGGLRSATQDLPELLRFIRTRRQDLAHVGGGC